MNDVNGNGSCCCSELTGRGNHIEPEYFRLHSCSYVCHRNAVLRETERMADDLVAVVRAGADNGASERHWTRILPAPSTNFMRSRATARPKHESQSKLV